MLLKTLNAARKASSGKAAPTVRSQPTNPVPVNIESSFIGPEVTSISEVVTGTFHYNSRVDRVSAIPQVQNQLPTVTVPIPQDQQVVYATLKLLQEKVAGLEEGQVQMRRTIEDLRNECSTLKRELKRSREARPVVEEIDPDQEDVFDISMPRIPRPKSQSREVKKLHEAKAMEAAVADATATVPPAPPTHAATVATVRPAPAAPHLTAPTCPAPALPSSPPKAAPTQTKRNITGDTQIEAVRETFQPAATENVIRREVMVPISSACESDKRFFGVEVKVNFQGLSLG
jgi:hypothetical protein